MGTTSAVMARADLSLYVAGHQPCTHLLGHPPMRAPPPRLGTRRQVASCHWSSCSPVRVVCLSPTLSSATSTTRGQAGSVGRGALPAATDPESPPLP
jgi:hypothetical protein